MKNTLTKNAVKYAMHLLIETNGSTTSLEVKKLLRDLAYKAKQKDVSEYMNEVYEEIYSDIERTLDVTTNEYYVYTHITDTLSDDDDDDDDDTIENELVDAINSENELADAIYAFNMSIQLETTDNPMINKVVTVGETKISKTSDVSREPEFILYTDSALDLFKTDTANNDKWVVFHKDGDDEYHIYNENLTRDQVRSRYATLLGTKIQDVRSRKLMNF